MSFDPKTLEHWINPHGLSLTCKRVPPPGDDDFVPPEHVEYLRPEEDWFEMCFEGWLRGGYRRNSCTLLVALPIISKDGRFMLKDGERVVVHRCFPDYSAPADQRRFFFRKPATVVIDQLQKAFAEAMKDFYFTGVPPHSQSVRQKIRRIFTDSVFFPILNQNPIARQSLHELVYLDIPSSLNLEDMRFPRELDGILDPTSTSQGTKINRAYRMCEGVEIHSEGTAQSHGSPMCSTNMANALAVDMSMRNHLLRTSFEGSLELEKAEKPYICGARHMLEGKHLNVALMNFKADTWEDCIAISQSCATSFAAMRYHTEVIESHGPIALKVRPGQEIRNHEHLADGVDDKGKPQSFYSRKMLTEGWVDRITVTRSMKQDRPILRWRFWMVRRAPLMTGDKITTRFGTKGVVKVIPDELMPQMLDGTPVDACISPESVIGRKASGVLWEMMLNKKLQSEDRRIVLEHGKQLFVHLEDSLPTFKDLVEEGWGAKTQLIWKRNKLPHQTFIGPLYTVRLDKLAQEQASIQAGDQHTNHHGVPVDSGKLGGQKRDLAKLIAMESHGYVEIIEHNLHDHTAGVDHFAKLASVLEPKQFA